MTLGQIRYLKRGLLLLFFASGTYVSMQVWKGLRARESRSASSFDEPADPTSRQIEIQQLDSEGNVAWTLKSAESIGKSESAQHFRQVEIRFSAGKEETPVVVTADRCELRENEAIFLEGNVVVRDEGPLRLEATTLEFRRRPDRAWSTEPVRYFGDGLEGDAGSMRYRIRRGELDLGEGVSMTLQRGSEAPIRVTSQRALFRRRESWLRYVDEVHVRQSNRALDCNDLQVYFTEDRESVERLEAFENVDWRINVAASEFQDGEPGGSSTSITSEPGLKRLLTEKLEVYLREGGEQLERVRALEGGRLVMTLPEDTLAGYHKELEGHTLVFDFDEAGELTTLRGRGGVVLTLTPVAGSTGEKKTVTARQLETDFDPVTGEMLEARCERSVTFEQGGARAEADRGTFLVANSLLVLQESPRLWDERAKLHADEIHINVESGDVKGIGEVRSTSLPTSRQKVFPGAGDEAVYFVADRVSYDRQQDVAVYTDRARGFQGQSRIEADRIAIRQSAGDLDARGGVRTVFLQRLAGDVDGPPRPTVTLAEELDYRSETNVMLYRGGVDMRAETMSLRSQELDLQLAPEAGEVRELVAQGQVVIQTQNGRAAGDTAIYSPDDDRVTVTGEKAWLENAGRLTEGKQLTFSLTDDTIFVDGREQNRTKTTYSSKPRPN